MDTYNYEYEGDSRYCYSGSNTLINLLNITDPSFVEAERRYTAVTTMEVSESPVRGSFDLAHLMAIHKAIFLDIFAWAGKLRDVNIAKGNQFCQSAYLVDYATELFDRLKAENYLAETDPSKLPVRLAYGYHLDFSTVTDIEMVEASVMAFDLDYTKLNKLIAPSSQ
ncbi:MAG: hypothetical protein LBL23_08340 [Coriobacteriales bacterium]|jgi:cell filamentation protein|nr:hypothetical protein [Coriobacteriales bacterium]